MSGHRCGPDSSTDCVVAEATHSHFATEDPRGILVGRRRRTLTLEPAGGLDLHPADGGSVSRETVAQVIAAVIENDTTIGRNLPFTDGTTSIAEGLVA